MFGNCSVLSLKRGWVNRRVSWNYRIGKVQRARCGSAYPNIQGREFSVTLLLLWFHTHSKKIQSDNLSFTAERDYLDTGKQAFQASWWFYFSINRHSVLYIRFANLVNVTPSFLPTFLLLPQKGKNYSWWAKTIKFLMAKPWTTVNLSG